MDSCTYWRTAYVLLRNPAYQNWHILSSTAISQRVHWMISSSPSHFKLEIIIERSLSVVAFVCLDDFNEPVGCSFIHWDGL